MAAAGIVGISPRKFTPVTTVAGRDAAPIPDLVCRDFDRGRLNAVWISDITYLDHRPGLALPVRGPRRLLTPGPRLGDRGPPAHRPRRGRHSPRRSPCAATCPTRSSSTPTAAPSTPPPSSPRPPPTCGLAQSVGRTGVCWDNAAAESFWSTLKTEYYDRHHWATKAEARHGVGDLDRRPLQPPPPTLSTRHAQPRNIRKAHPQTAQAA